MKLIIKKTIKINIKKTRHFSQNLLNWFDQHGRKDLPWQHDKTPYRVWVSEIMLQQTQVSNVIDYYQRFMTHFPTLESLANANEDAVLEQWAGLGYYARGRNLLKSAKIIQAEHQGNFPNTHEAIVQLPGIGRSTAGAILSIAFKQQATILDGNVKRVLCRHEAIEEWSGERLTEKELWDVADSYTPTNRVDDYTQAIMDLGATLCTRRAPSCARCPLSDSCLAFKQERQNELPKSKPKKAIPQKHTWIIQLESTHDKDPRILLEKRPSPGIWGGLYSLPEKPAELSADQIIEQCEQEFSVKVIKNQTMPPFGHVFSHYKLELKPIKLHVTAPPLSVCENKQQLWVTETEIQSLGLPAPIKKYLNKS